MQVLHLRGGVPFGAWDSHFGRETEYSDFLVLALARPRRPSWGLSPRLLCDVLARTLAVPVRRGQAAARLLLVNGQWNLPSGGPPLDYAVRADGEA